MNRSELNQFERALAAKYEDLERATGKREGIAIERTADALDEVLYAAQRELSTRSLERRTGILHSVRGALERVSDGTYGTCLDCEEEISRKRLVAMPWATLCISCQEHADRQARGIHPVARYDRFDQAA